MTEQEAREAKERADMIVNKVRDLVALEDKVLEARESVRQLSLNDTSPDDLQEDPITKRQSALAVLEAQLKESVEDLDSITDELKWATPCFRAYVLSQMSELVGTLKACDTLECHFLHLQAFPRFAAGTFLAAY